MKDKVLKAELMSSIERIAVALRSYTDMPLACEVFIETREKEPEEGTDFVAVKLSWNSEDENGVIFDKGIRIRYRWDRHDGEKILETYTCYGGHDYDS